MPLSRFLLLTFVVASLGVAAELLLLEHFDGWRQLIPLGVIALALVAVIWNSRGRSPAAERFVRITLGLMAASGLVGQGLHFWGNMEWERESDATIRGWPLLVAAMTGATPALAPGTMILLAAVGYAGLRARRPPA